MIGTSALRGWSVTFRTPCVSGHPANSLLYVPIDVSENAISSLLRLLPLAYFHTSGNGVKGHGSMGRIGHYGWVTDQRTLTHVPCWYSSHIEVSVSVIDRREQIEQFRLKG